MNIVAPLIGGLAMIAGPVLAGAGGAGTWAISFFAVAAVVAVVLVLAPEAWATPVHLALFAAVDAASAAFLFALGRWMAIALAWHPGWGALPPILLTLAGAGLFISVVRQELRQGRGDLDV